MVGWSDGAITGLNLAMNYTSRIDRVFAHGANVQADQSLPGRDDPIINSNSGSLDADLASGGMTHATGASLTKRDATDNYTCPTLSPTLEKCGAMMQGVEA